MRLPRRHHDDGIHHSAVIAADPNDPGGYVSRLHPGALRSGRGGQRARGPGRDTAEDQTDQPRAGPRSTHPRPVREVAGRSAASRLRQADYVARSVAIAALSVPSFWLATLLITYGSIGIPIGVPKLPPLVVIHYTPPLGREINASLSQNLRLILPAAIILGIGLSGSIMRLMRTQMLEVMRQDYIRTAQAKGLHARVILMRHALRNSLIPVITIIGLQLPVIVGGSVVLESIFSLPGMGYYFLQSLIQRDFTVFQAVTVIAAAVIVLSNLLVDLSYPLFDPRIRYS